ncbi:MAG: hypothetical protein WAO71_00820 [Gallionella sp.]
MADKLLQHTQLDGIKEYSAALDTLCELAERDLYFFDRNLEGVGFNTEARYSMLHRFLLASPAHKLYVLVYDTHYLTTLCPRMMLLLRQFSGRMTIRQVPNSLQHIYTPFAVADDAHTVRRFHFDDPRGVFEQYDASQARVLKACFLEMWAASHHTLSPDRLGL